MLPSQFIIVDGGSTDGTIDILKYYASKYKWIKLLVRPGANVSEGRNAAIRLSKDKVIAVTDAGCILDKDWLKNISSPVCNRNCDVSYGASVPVYNNCFEYAQALFYTKSVKRNFLKIPSSRNICFRKEVWDTVGGYPEATLAAEDTKFNIEVERRGYSFEFVKDAIVYWEMRPTVSALWKQFFKYGRGDAIQRTFFYVRGVKLFLFGLASYIIVGVLLLFLSSLDVLLLWLSFPFILLVLIGAYFSILTKKLCLLYYFPIASVVRLFAYFSGFLRGLVYPKE